MLKIDHLAVSAGTLQEGRAWVEEVLGMPMQEGGKHEYFGTHNALLGFSGGMYLEVIAIDPYAPAPDVTRWFDLDRFAGEPRLSNWICQTDQIDGALEELPEAGDAVSLKRDALRWQMAVPRTGILPFDNCFPAIIEWETNVHPARRLPPSGCALKKLTIFHPEASKLKARLSSLLQDKRLFYKKGAPRLRAEIDTPMGLRVLE